jgi:hypothetical protein
VEERQLAHRRAVENKKVPGLGRHGDQKDYLLISSSGVQQGFLPLMRWKESTDISITRIRPGTSAIIFRGDATPNPARPFDL